MNNLLVSAGLVLDIVFGIILVLGLVFGVRTGFWRGMCALLGTIFSLLMGIMFCRKMQAFIDGTLGLNMTGAIQGGLRSTTLPEEVANSLGEWFAILISFLIIVVLVRFTAWLIGKLGKALTSKSKFFRVIDRLFGGLLGLVQAALSLSFFLSICYWIPWEALHNFINSSSIVSKIYIDWIPQFASFPPLIIKPTTVEGEGSEAFAHLVLWLKTL
ncbi:MAG: CvpA family protein [Clostridiales bacterium]|nr:CvpA family protein [Clostridiales bacterium]